MAPKRPAQKVRSAHAGDMPTLHSLHDSPHPLEELHGSSRRSTLLSPTFFASINQKRNVQNGLARKKKRHKEGLKQAKNNSREDTNDRDATARTICEKAATPHHVLDVTPWLSSEFQRQQRYNLRPRKVVSYAERSTRRINVRLRPSGQRRDDKQCEEDIFEQGSRNRRTPSLYEHGPSNIRGRRTLALSIDDRRRDLSNMR